MNLVGYCRVSTDKSDQLNSLETQKDFFADYCKNNGHTLVKLYADEGISGTKLKKRTEFQSLLRDAHSGIFDMVIVKDISRFARNTVDLLTSIRELKALNIDTLFLTANMNVLGNSEFVLTVFGALAQEESANMSKRVKFGKQQNAKEGKVPNLIYGYDKIIGDYFNLAINEDEARIVTRIYNLYIYEGLGMTKIAMLLNSECHKTKRNTNFTQAGVQYILSNPIYIGKVTNGKEEVKDFLTGARESKDKSEWKVVENPNLRIIDDDLFYKAQEIRQKRFKAFKIDSERQSNRYLFSTLIKCADCGYSFRRTHRIYKNTYIKWVCQTRNHDGKDACSNTVVVDEDDLIKAIDEYIADFISNKDEIIKRVQKSFIERYKCKNSSAAKEKSLSKSLLEIDKKRKKYMELFADDLIDKPELTRQLTSLNDEKKRCEGELNLLRYNLDKTDKLENLLQQSMGELENITSVASLDNAALKRLIKQILVHNDGTIEIQLRLLTELGLSETSQVRMYGT